MTKYEVGQQPCKNFKQKMTGEFGNVHECYCGHSIGNDCGKTVSFCENCNSDHHEGGYESCQCKGKGFELNCLTPTKKCPTCGQDVKRG